ncbi:hypothetical protein M9H77_18538 [Catharanthus roseus]|uniref:Uncharacterized protein n=1 Tax=Catharanthus roseus TaxID=4058 RepID=A0ACC0B7S1_CATRO|nr:hypothetical protein M9H77_18538 [Catharanthus roseus]
MSLSREETFSRGSRVVGKSFNVDKNIIIIIFLRKKISMPNYDFTSMNSLVSIFGIETPCTIFTRVSCHLWTFKTLRSVKEIKEAQSLLRSRTFEVDEGYPLWDEFFG